MNTQPHFEELLRLFEKNEVAYLVVGGYAVAFYGYPRFTKDIDLYFRISDENIDRIISSLCEFGFDRESLPRVLFAEKGNILKFGLEPVRIDLLNEIDGVEFDSVFPRKVRGQYGTVEVPFIAKDDLIRNKQASGRLQDLADVEKLQ